MNTRYIGFLCAGMVAAIFWWSFKPAPFVFVDFDQSMQKRTYQYVLDDADAQWRAVFYELFKTFYETKTCQWADDMSVAEQQSRGIPKIIHQIWLGSPFPEKYKKYQQSWKKYHPDWEYRLWTETEIARLPMINRKLYEKSVNYGERSDIVRYEILCQFGGVYVDTDFEALRSLNPLCHRFEFFIGIQPLDTNAMQFGIGLIGSCPWHPFLKQAISAMAKNCDEQKQIIFRTGPMFLTRLFYDVHANLVGRFAVLPSTYFYPRGYAQAESPRSAWKKPESFAVHHWAASWRDRSGWLPGIFLTNG